VLNPTSRGGRLTAVSLTALTAVGSVVAAQGRAHAAVGGSKSVDRISGDSRYETAIAASKSLWPDYGDPSDTLHAHTVVIAKGDDYPDALGGIPLASAKQGPLLVTPGTGLEPEVLDEVKRVLDPTAGNTVYVLGGTNALSPTVDTDLEAAGYVVKRIGGADRFETSLMIADELGDPKRVVVATGLNFPDALSAGPVASMGGVGRPGAILLSNGTSLTPAVQSYINGITASAPSQDHFVAAIGGPAITAVKAAIPSGQVANLLQAPGDTRYDTACNAASIWLAQSKPSNPAAIGIATGGNFPDALGGGAAIAQIPGPLLLTPPSGLPSCVISDLTAAHSGLQWVEVYGGIGAVPDSIVTQLHNIVGF
jgi:hypothetical protein